MAARAGVPADVRDELDPRAGEQREERVELVRRVADGQELDDGWSPSASESAARWAGRAAL